MLRRIALQLLPLLLAAGLSGCGSDAIPERSTPEAASALELEVRGPIGPAAVEYVTGHLTEAPHRNAGVVVLTLDTPGGLESAMRDIVHAILDAPIPVIIYVSPSGARAASAGTYMVYASHVAAMAPGTHLGAATPVQLGGGFGPRPDKADGDKATNPLQAKAVNDAVAFIRGLAGLRGRSADWAEKAVRDAATLTASDALAQGVIDLMAQDLASLLREADGRTVRVRNKQVQLASAGLPIVAARPDLRIQVLAAITNPTIAYMLLLIGFYGVLLEFISPGAIFPGVIGAIAFLVGLYGLNFLPISYAGAGLLALGVALMIAEAFLPSFGVLGIGGAVAFAAGSLFLIRGDIPGFRLPWPVVAAATACSAGFILIALSAAWRAHLRKVVTGDVTLLGSAARVLNWAEQEGDVEVHGERWHAQSPAVLSPGQRVRIVERRGLTLRVEPEFHSTEQP